MRLRSLLVCALICSGLVTSAQAYFKDVSTEHPNIHAVLFLQALGMVEGYEDGTFRAEQPVTRAEFTKLLVESMQVRPPNLNNCFTDVGEEWFAPYVCYAKREGIVKGIDTAHFAPAAKVTRAEALKMTLHAFQMTNNLPVVTKSLFRDVQPKDWYAGYMHRARLDNIYGESEYAFPNTAITRGGAAEMLYRPMMIQILDTPQFDAVQAAEFMRVEMRIDGNAPALNPQLHGDATDQLAIYQDVADQLRVLHPQGGQVPAEDFVYSSIEGMTKELGDPYTLFLRPKESKEFVDSLNGDLEGIGVEIAQDPKGALIMNVLPDSPAEKGGLQAGDIVTKADDKSFAGKSTEEIITVMRGKEGTQVTLQFLRGMEEKTVTLTRARIHIPSVTHERKDKLEVIRLTQFGGETAQELRVVLEALPVDTKGIILDLRNNGGGYMDISETIASFFLPEGSEVFTLQDSQGREDVVSSRGTPLTQLPMVVLVNGYSASAAEVIAGALRDHERATLVGEQTFGKGTVQSLVTYADGSMLRVTIAQWFTPDGESVGDVKGNHKGLTPKTLVSDDEATPQDEQLETATQLLQ